MADQYVGEIRIFGGNYAPQGWALCNGQLLSISDYAALFSLIGNTYGGDGQTTFAVPNLSGRAVVHNGSGYTLGQAGGTETVTLTVTQLPAHSHPVRAAEASGDNASPAGNLWAVNGTTAFASDTSGAVAMNPQAITATGGSQPHDNMMPYLAVNYIIALEGNYPTFN
jgi:microcystin-dependent protein